MKVKLGGPCPALKKTALEFAEHTSVHGVSYVAEKKVAHPVLKRQDRLGKDPFAGFGTVVEDITGSGYTKNQPILLGAF